MKQIGCDGWWQNGKPTNVRWEGTKLTAEKGLVLKTWSSEVVMKDFFFFWGCAEVVMKVFFFFFCGFCIFLAERLLGDWWCTGC